MNFSVIKSLLAVWLMLACGSRAGLMAGRAGAQTFDSRGVKIHYTIDGKGPPVVLIHGLYSSEGINWRLPGTIRLLSADYEVIALDLRGHGSSDKPQEEEAYGVQMAEDVVRLLDHLKIPKAHVVGYSMGGMIAMKLVATHPDRVQSVALGGMGWLREGSGLQKFWSMIPERRGIGTPPACPRSFGALALSGAEVKAIRVPVAMFVGDHDPTRQMYVEPLHVARPDFPVTVIEGAGHLNCIVKPEFKDGLKTWLDAQRARGK
jgi:pimeloyl-ACP methyl ester carboxylesterase